MPFDASHHVHVARVLLRANVFPDAGDDTERVPRSIDDNVVAHMELSADWHLVELASELVGVPWILPGAKKAGRNAVDAFAGVIGSPCTL